MPAMSLLPVGHAPSDTQVVLGDIDTMIDTMIDDTPVFTLMSTGTKINIHNQFTFFSLVDTFRCYNYKLPRSVPADLSNQMSAPEWQSFRTVVEAALAPVSANIWRGRTLCRLVIFVVLPFSAMTWFLGEGLSVKQGEPALVALLNLSTIILVVFICFCVAAVITIVLAIWYHISRSMEDSFKGHMSKVDHALASLSNENNDFTFTMEKEMVDISSVFSCCHNGCQTDNESCGSHRESVYIIKVRGKLSAGTVRTQHMDTATARAAPGTGGAAARQRREDRLDALEARAAQRREDREDQQGQQGQQTGDDDSLEYEDFSEGDDE
jgi:hypothetical protein